MAVSSVSLINTPQAGNRTMRYLLAGIYLSVSLGASFVQAEPVLFTGSSGGLSASVSFDAVGTDLHVVISNTSAADVTAPGGLLAAVFFNVAGDPLLTRVSATTLGPTYLNGGQVNATGTSVGGEWAYLNGLAQYGANAGISSSGYGIFGAGDVFPPGTNLAGPASPNGIQYALTSAGDDLLTQNAGISEITKSSVEFVLSGFNLPLSSISSVTFQYDASLTATHLAGTPMQQVSHSAHVAAQ